MARASKTSKRLLAWLAIVLAGAAAGCAAFNLLELSIVLTVLLGATALFGALWGVAYSYRDRLSELDGVFELDDRESRKLSAALRESGRQANRALAVAAVCLVVAVWPWFVDKAGYVVDQWLIALAGAALGSLAFLNWLFTELKDDAVVFRSWMKRRQAESERRAEALKRLDGGFKAVVGLDDRSSLKFSGHLKEHPAHHIT